MNKLYHSIQLTTAPFQHINCLEHDWDFLWNGMKNSGKNFKKSHSILWNRIKIAQKSTRLALNHYAECHCAECHYAECHYAECHYAECHYAECHYAECYFAECHYAECHFAECHNAECLC